MKKLSVILLCLVAVSFTQCQKGDKGDTGPAGPAGSSGTSNVQTFVYNNQPWANSNTEIILSVSAISQNILDKGAVMTYLKNTGDVTWTTIPNLYYPVITGLGYVRISNGWGSPGAVDVKVVVIPGS